MTRKLATACAAVAGAAGLYAAPAVAAPARVLQRFQISLAGAASPVTATGLALNGAGTATPSGPASFAMSFPTGPASLTESVQQTVGGLGPGCVDIRRESGTFTFSYSPTAQPGLRFGGNGTFTSSSLTIYHQNAGGGCDTAGAPLFQFGSVDAGATEVFAVL
jgi:hypothetical protein